MIVASDRSFAAPVRGMPAWQQVPAAGNGRVYAVSDPTYHSAGSMLRLRSNRLLGVQWLARLLYPTLFPEPLAPVVKASHARYCERTPTAAQVQALVRESGLSH